MIERGGVGWEGGEGRGGVGRDLTLAPLGWPSLSVHCLGLSPPPVVDGVSLPPQSPLLADPGPARD